MEIRTFLNLGAGEVHDGFNHVVEGLGFGGGGGFVVDFFAFTAAGDEATGFQWSQVMGDGGAGHFYHGSNVSDAFFAVAQQPEDFEAGRIAYLFEDVGCGLEVLYLV